MDETLETIKEQIYRKMENILTANEDVATYHEWQANMQFLQVYLSFKILDELKRLNDAT